VDEVVARVQRLARTPYAVQCLGDSVASMGGRGVDGRDVQHALEHAFVATQSGPDVLVTGPTIDGESLSLVVRVIEDCLYVSNVVL
jgi:hypothetical protein